MAFLYLTFPLDKIQISKIEHASELLSLEYAQAPTSEDLTYLNGLFKKRPGIALKLVRTTSELTEHLKNLTHLKRLWLQSAMGDFEFLRFLPQMEELSISSQENHSLKPLEALVNLRELAIDGKFQHVKSIGKLVNVQKLDLNIHYPNLDFLVSFKKLASLSLSGGIGNLQSLEKLASLQGLFLKKVLRANATLLKPIASLKNLQTLHLEDLGLVNDFQWLQETKIRSLFLVNLMYLKTFEGLQHFSELEIIAVRGNFKYQKDWDFLPFLSCKKLKRIDIPFKQNSKNKEVIQKLLSKVGKFSYNWPELKWRKG